MKNINSKLTKQISRHTSEDENFWRHHIAACSASGITKISYCKKNNVDYHRFRNWTKKLSAKNLHLSKPADLSSKPSELIPVELKLTTKQNNSAILCTINLKSGHVLQLHDQQAWLMLLERWL